MAINDSTAIDAATNNSTVPESRETAINNDVGRATRTEGKERGCASATNVVNESNVAAKANGSPKVRVGDLLV